MTGRVGRRGPRKVAERLRRLLVILPWVMERGEATVAELAERFDVGEDELVKDLELAAMCGLPPFIDEMIDVYIDEGVVYAGVPRLFTKPLRLTATALGKLALLLGDDAVVVDTSQPPATADVIAAARTSERLVVRYWSAHSDETTEREITPRTVFLDRGHWYVIADDTRTGEQRTFRLDRVERWAHTGRFDEPRTVAAPTGEDWFVDVGRGEVPVARPAGRRGRCRFAGAQRSGARARRRARGRPGGHRRALVARPAAALGHRSGGDRAGAVAWSRCGCRSGAVGPLQGRSGRRLSVHA